MTAAGKENTMIIIYRGQMNNTSNKKSKSTQTNIPDHVIESLARTILPSIKAYYESEQGHKEFAEWQRKKELGKNKGV